MADPITAADDSAPPPAALRTAFAQVVRDCLWPAALGMGGVYAFTAVSHGLRLEPDVRLPLTLYAAATAVFFVAAALLLRRRPASLRLAHPLAACFALLALSNEFLQQQLLGHPELQGYTSLYLLAIGLFFLSTPWFLLCVVIGLAAWGVAAWRDGVGGQAIEWAYAHGAAVALGLAAHLSRKRTIARMEGLRAAAAHAAQLQLALAELRASESLFRQFADHSGQAFWINDGRTHQVAYINRVYETLFGRLIERLRDDPLDWLAAVHPEDRGRISRAYLDCAATGRFDERYRIIGPDGTVRWVHDHGFLIGADSGDVRRVGGITRDVTDRVLAEQQLIASRQRLTDLIADVDGIVWECDPYSFRYGFVSPRAPGILGYPVEQWLADPAFFTTLLHPDDRDRVLARRRQCVEAGADFELEYRAVSVDGRIVWLRDKSRIVRDAGGCIDRLRGILIDVSESMRVAQALRDSQEVLDKAQTIAQLGSWTWEVQQQRVIWSSQMYTIHGVTPGDFDGSWMFALQMVHPDDQQLVWKACEQALASGKVETVEYRVIRPDGETRNMRAQGELHFAEQGALQRVIGTVQDITDLRLAEAERARLEEELRQVQKLEAVGTLASGVAHDFNNLLTAINGYADLARKTLPADHAARRSLDMIELATDQAAGVTRGLLTFAHHTPYQKSPTDLAPNIRQSVLLLRRLLPASIDFIEDLPEEGEVYVNADAHQLQQVWLNLAVNARDSMPRGGKLILRLRRFTDAPVNPQDSWHGQVVDAAVITVTDTGSGMDEATMARVFEPYFTTKPRGQGTGLGLSISHSIILDHGGRIRVQSEPGKGTRFTIYLPCCLPPDEASHPAPRAAPAAGSAGETILLAEDNEFVRAIMASSLQAAGYHVIAAVDGDELVEAYDRQRGKVGLIILDLDLPKQSGQACLDHVRATGDAVPVLIITGNAMLAAAPGRIEMKETVLMKPFPVARLIELVNETLAGNVSAG